MARLRLAAGWLGDRRDTIVVLLLAAAFGWLGKQQLENHSTGKVAHKAALEAKSTAEEAKELAIVSHRDAERLNEVTAVAAQAYCKLKLYDELSGTTSSRLFARLGVLPPSVARGVRDALRLVASISSPRVCDTATSVPTSPGKHRRSSTVTSTAIERQLRVIERQPVPVRAHISPPAPRRLVAPAPRHRKPSVRLPAPPAASVPAPAPHEQGGGNSQGEGQNEQRAAPQVEVEVPGLLKACANAGPAEHDPHCRGVSVGQ